VIGQAWTKVIRMRAACSAASAAALLALASAAATPSATQLAQQAEAVSADAAHGRILYLRHCQSCHGPHAWGDAPREIPALAGQRSRYLVAQLARFATGERAGSTMHGSAMHEALQPADVYRPQAIADLAAYLAQAARNPSPAHAEDRTPASAGAIFRSACSSCHGVDGAGRKAEQVPAIGGQHYDYLLSRLQMFGGAGGHPWGLEQTAHATPAQQQALADYISRLAYLSSGASP
jgi:cytochrome c553